MRFLTKWTIVSAVLLSTSTVVVEAAGDEACSENDSSALLSSLSDNEKKIVKAHEENPGAGVDILQGDAKESGEFVFIGSFPANYVFPEHYHPAYEELTILSGSVFIGGMDGQPMSKGAAMLHCKGDLHKLPAKTTHWLFTTQEPVVFKYVSQGPYGIVFTTDERPHLANSVTQDAVATYDMDTITVTGTRDPQPLENLVGNTSVLNHSLDWVKHTHIQESLVRVPGANLARGNGQEYLPALRSPILTGAGACGSVLAAVDGIALRSAGFCNINELFGAHTEMAERIEVVRGPASALFGSNAMHGVVNVISPTVASKSKYELGVEGGPHDYSRLTLSASDWMGEHGLRADLSLSHDGAYRADSGFDQQKLSLRHEHGGGALSVTTTLAMTNLNQETAGYVIGREAYKDDDLRASNPNPEAYRDAVSVSASSRFGYRLSDASHFAVTPYVRYTDMNFLQHFLPGDPLEENGHQSIGLQTSYHAELDWGLNLVAGLDLEYTEGFLKQSQDAPTQGSAFLQATIPEGMHYDYQVEALMAAPFIHSTWSLNEKLTMTAGLRFEMMDYTYDNRMLDGRTDDKGTACGFGGCRYSRPADRRDDFANSSPKLGLLYHLSDNIQSYINLAHGFRSPQATELYRLQRSQNVADLDSEELNSLELGLRGKGRDIVYEILLFAMKKQNVIFRDSNFFNVSDGETRHQGVELSLAYALSEQWHMDVVASYAEHEYNDDRVIGQSLIDGNEVDSAPKHFGSARLRWDLNQSSLIELEWIHQGDYFTDPENLHRYEGHDLLNLRARWQPEQNYNISAQLTNLTDRKYAERADYTGFTGDRYFPGEPVALRVGLERKW